MARARNLKPSFFANDILAECDPMARLLFAGLWTIADRDGRMEYRPRKIKGILFPYDNCDIEPLVEQLAARGFVVVYRAGGINVLAIPTFGEHQRCHPDERSEGFPPPEGNFPATCASFLLPLSSNPLASNPLASVATSYPPKRRNRSPQKHAITWNVESGWQGITDVDRQNWAKAYPACTVDIELMRATEWLIANPTRAHKSNWRKFIVSWLTRSQDRGGTIRSAGKTPEDVAKKASLDRKARDFANYQPAPYRTPKEVAALAQSLRLTEEDL